MLLNSPHFGVLISTKTVRRANQATIERSREARRRGLSLAEYQRLHKEDYVHRIGGKTYDFYAIGKKIMSNKEKLKNLLHFLKRKTNKQNLNYFSVQNVLNTDIFCM